MIDIISNSIVFFGFLVLIFCIMAVLHNRLGYFREIFQPLKISKEATTRLMWLCEEIKSNKYRCTVTENYFLVLEDISTSEKQYVVANHKSFFFGCAYTFSNEFGSIVVGPVFKTIPNKNSRTEFKKVLLQYLDTKEHKNLNIVKNNKENSITLQ